MNMEAIKQISIFMENKYGRMARVAKALADANVNIRALTIAEAGDFGIVRMVVDDMDKGYKVLREEGFTVSETEVLAVEIEDSPGGLFEIANTLGENNINIDYAYAFVTAKSERAMLILRVEDISGATRVLNEGGIRTATKRKIQQI